MKDFIKIAVAVLIMAAAVPMRAQEWEFKKIAADELRGTKADSVAVFHTKEASVLVSFTNEEIWVKAKKGVFDYHKNEYYILIGMYDTDGNMLSKDRVFCYYPNANSHTLLNIRNAHHLFRKHPGDSIATRFIDHLNSGKGFIRIITPMYLDTSLDIIIPCFTNKLSESE